MSAQIGDRCLGEWKFRCPDAGEGYDAGIITIKNDSVYLEYPGSGDVLPSIWTKFKNGILSFSVRFNGQAVICTLKFEDENILSGTLATKYGEYPLILFKEQEVLPGLISEI